MFENYEIVNPESEHLKGSVIISIENLEDLETKIYNYNLDKDNKLGKRTIDFMKTNITLAKMVKRNLF